MLSLFILIYTRGYGGRYVLFFKKNISQKPPSKVSSFPYRVRSGECLILILKKFGIEERVFPSLVDKIRRLNPRIKDINKLYPGEIIYLPQSLRKNGEVSHRVYPYIPFPYKVKKGDSVVKLLKVRAHIPNYLIFNEYLNIFKKLNPAIRDINTLSPGQRIILPLRNLPEATNRKPLSSFPLSYPGKQRVQVKIQHPLLEEKKALCFSLLSHLGFSVTTGEEMLYPTKSGEWVSIDTTSTPLIRSPWGDVFILLPQASTPSSYHIKLLKRIGYVIPIRSWSPRELLKKLSIHLDNRMILWKKGTTLLIPCNNMVVETKAYLQLALRARKTSRRSYFIFLKKIPKQDYETSLVWNILRKRNIYVFYIKKRLIQQLSGENTKISQLYIPYMETIPSHLVSQFIRYSLFPPLVLSMKVWKIPRRAHKKREIYLVGENSPYVVALLRIKGYTAYLLSRSP